MSPQERVFFYNFLVLSAVQHCFICHPSDFTVLEDTEIEPPPGQLRLRHWLSDAPSMHSAGSHPPFKEAFSSGYCLTLPPHSLATQL
jgi:hypothetical protein